MDRSTKGTVERFTISFTNASLDGNRLSGKVHTYGTTTQRNGEQWTFAPGAFSKVLRDPGTDAVAAWNHNLDMPLGRQSNNTLKLEETEDGLNFSLELPNTSYADDLKELIDRGDVNGMSFAGDIGKGKVTKTSDGQTLRTFTEVRGLQDISPVSVPAFTGTSLNHFSNSFENESIKSQLIRAEQRVMNG